MRGGILAAAVRRVTVSSGAQLHTTTLQRKLIVLRGIHAKLEMTPWNSKLLRQLAAASSQRHSRDRLRAPATTELSREDLVGPFTFILAVHDPHDMTQPQMTQFEIDLHGMGSVVM